MDELTAKIILNRILLREDDERNKIFITPVNDEESETDHVYVNFNNKYNNHKMKDRVELGNDFYSSDQLEAIAWWLRIKNNECKQLKA